MGDVVMTVPIIRCLEKKYPENKFIFVTRPKFKPFFEEFKNVEIFELDLKNRHKGVLGLFRLFSERIIKQQSPFAGDLNHIHHLLNKKFNSLHTSLLTNGFIFLPLIISHYLEFKIVVFIFQFIVYYIVVYRFKKF